MSDLATASLVPTLAAVAVGGLATYALVGGFRGGAAPAAEAAARAAEEGAEAAAAELLAGDAAAGPAGRRKKKKKKKKGKKGAAAERAAEKGREEEEAGSDADSDAPEPTPKKKPKKKTKKGSAAASHGAAKVKPAAAPPPPPPRAAAPRQHVAPADDDEWVSVRAAPRRAKHPPKPKRAAAGPSSEAVVVDAKRIGLIIGPKGATLQALEAASGCTLEVRAPDKDAPVGSGARATVLLSGGNKEQTAAARGAVLELAAKGFATLLQTDKTFGESYVEVHPRHLSALVGSGGKTIQALQKGCRVTLTIPPTDWYPGAPEPIVGGTPPCRVGIAGSSADAARAREVVRALVQYHHHEVTHPGQVHRGLYVPGHCLGIVVGPRGGELKHIRGNYGVEVYLPRGDGEEEEVLVVGKGASVDRAIVHIERLIERDAAQRDGKYSDEAY